MDDFIDRPLLCVYVWEISKKKRFDFGIFNHVLSFKKKTYLAIVKSLFFIYWWYFILCYLNLFTIYTNPYTFYPLNLFQYSFSYYSLISLIATSYAFISHYNYFSFYYHRTIPPSYKNYLIVYYLGLDGIFRYRCRVRKIIAFGVRGC